MAEAFALSTTVTCEEWMISIWILWFLKVCPWFARVFRSRNEVQIITLYSEVGIRFLPEYICFGKSKTPPETSPSHIKIFVWRHVQGAGNTLYQVSSLGKFAIVCYSTLLFIDIFRLFNFAEIKVLLKFVIFPANYQLSLKYFDILSR